MKQTTVKGKRGLRYYLSAFQVTSILRTLWGLNLFLAEGRLMYYYFVVRGEKTQYIKVGYTTFFNLKTGNFKLQIIDATFFSDPLQWEFDQSMKSLLIQYQANQLKRLN
jgi:hypothetical protein